MKRPFNAAQVPQAIALESVQVASPCHADWEAMRGDDRSRFCPSCAKNVYNLSAMTRDEAEILLVEKEGRLCVRYFLREDGTIMTQDCPVGVAALKERSPSFALWAGVASLLVLVGSLVSPSLMTGAHAQPEPTGDATPTQTIAPTPTPEAVEEVHPPVLGKIAPPPRSTPVPAPTEGSALLATLGEVRAVASPTVSLTPTATIQPNPIMGKPMMTQSTPVPTPRPTVQKLAVMGRISRHVPTPAVKPTPTPTPAAGVKPTPSPSLRPMMGAVAVTVPAKTPSAKAPKKTTKKD